MDCTVHGVTKSQTRLNDFQFHFQGLKAREQEACGQEAKACSEVGWGNRPLCLGPTQASGTRLPAPQPPSDSWAQPTDNRLPHPEECLTRRGRHPRPGKSTLNSATAETLMGNTTFGKSTMGEGLETERLSTHDGKSPG